MKYSKKQLLIMISTTFAFGLSFGLAKNSHAEVLAPKTLKNFLIEFATSDDEKSKCSENDLAVCSVIAPWFLQQSADFQKEAIADPAAILDVANLPTAVGDAVRSRLANGPIVGSASLGAPTGTNSFAIGSDGRPIIANGANASGFSWGQLIGQTANTGSGTSGSVPALSPASTPNWHYSAEESETGSTGVSSSSGSSSQPSNNSGTWVSDGSTSSGPANDGGITLPEPGYSATIRTERDVVTTRYNTLDDIIFAIDGALKEANVDRDTANKFLDFATRTIYEKAGQHFNDFIIDFTNNDIVTNNTHLQDEDANAVHPVLSPQQQEIIIQSLAKSPQNRPTPQWWDPSPSSSKNSNAYVLDPVVKRAPTAAAQRQISTNSGRAQLRLGNVGAGTNGNNPTGESLTVNASGPAVTGCGGPGKACSGI